MVLNRYPPPLDVEIVDTTSAEGFLATMSVKGLRVKHLAITVYHGGLVLTQGGGTKINSASLLGWGTTAVVGLIGLGLEHFTMGSLYSIASLDISENQIPAAEIDAVLTAGMEWGATVSCQYADLSGQTPPAVPSAVGTIIVSAADPENPPVPDCRGEYLYAGISGSPSPLWPTWTNGSFTLYYTGSGWQISHSGDMWDALTGPSAPNGVYTAGGTAVGDALIENGNEQFSKGALGADWLTAHGATIVPD